MYGHNEQNYMANCAAADSTSPLRNYRGADASQSPNA